MLTEKRQYQLLYFVLFASGNGVAAFRNVFLEDAGLSGSQMGIIGAILVASGMAAQPVWGIAADRYGRTKVALAIGAVGSALAALLYPAGMYVSSPFLVFVVASVVFSAFRSPIHPLADSMVLSSGLDYGKVRAFGSIAFGVGILALGWLIEWFGTPLIFYVYVVGMVVFVFTLRGLERPDADIAPDLRREGIALVKNRQFLLLLAVAVLIGAASAAGGSFFSVYMRAIDAGDSMTGAAWLLRTVAEAVVFVGAARLGLKHRGQLSLGAGAYTLSFLAYAVTGFLPMIFGIQIIHGIAIALFGLASVNLAHHLAPDGLASTSQAVVAALGLGSGRIVGQLVGGRLVDLVGVQDLYFFVAASTFLAGVVSLGFYLAAFEETGESEPTT